MNSKYFSKYFRKSLSTPLGKIQLVANETHLVGIHFDRETARAKWPTAKVNTSHPILHAAELQLMEYFAGRRQAFELPLAPEGTAFQRAAWRALEAIPYGETRSYSEQAKAIKNPKAVRAVGGANRVNPIGIVIPCHRVIGRNKTLTGYAGGLDIKRKLLELEGTAAQLRD